MKPILLLLAAALGLPASTLQTSVSALEVFSDHPRVILNSCSQSGTALSACSAGPITVSATASPGTVTISASHPSRPAGQFPPVTGTEFLAVSSFTDQLAIASTAPAGLVQYQLLVTTGFTGTTDDPSACVAAGFSLSHDNFPFPAPILASSPCSDAHDSTGQTTYNSPLEPFTSGVPITLTLAAAAAVMHRPSHVEAYYAPFNISLTVTLAGVSVFDANGQPLSDATVTSASAIPEPRTFWLILPLLGWSLKRTMLSATGHPQNRNSNI